MLRTSAALSWSGLAVLAGLVAGSRLPAQADPGLHSDSDDIAGVGSDTAAEVLNAIQATYSGHTPALVRGLASVDAHAHSPPPWEEGFLCGNPTIINSMGFSPCRVACVRPAP